jgi:hypothetical protein
MHKAVQEVKEEHVLSESSDRKDINRKGVPPVEIREVGRRI